MHDTKISINYETISVYLTQYVAVNHTHIFSLVVSDYMRYNHKNNRIWEKKLMFILKNRLYRPTYIIAIYKLYIIED